MASVVFWSLIIIISIKYLALVMRADNKGEGGILALTALVMPRSGVAAKGITAGVITLGVFGTSLLYGDGLITPAISVLSAVEGFEVATSAFEAWILPITIAILIALFSVQKRGTAKIARVFSPIMIVWFTVIGALGLRQVLLHPSVLRAISPSYGFELFLNHPWRAFLALGSIFLVVTGGEALYADMGHFGRRPIQISWYVIVLPALLLNYFGQAALLADDPEAIESPFYNLAPEWGITPLAILATMATVIASQALITGAYSLTTQAVQLDYLPRLKILHTSAHHIGQVYVPLVNWLLMVGCVGLVIGFRTSSALASAYGIAVTTTMMITTLLFYRVVRDRWGWSTAADGRHAHAAHVGRRRVPRRQRAEDPDRRLVPVGGRIRPGDPDDDVAARPRVGGRPDPPRRATDEGGRTGGARCPRRARARHRACICSRMRGPHRRRSWRTSSTTRCCTRRRCSCP